MPSRAGKRSNRRSRREYLSTICVPGRPALLSPRSASVRGGVGAHGLGANPPVCPTAQPAGVASPPGDTFGWCQCAGAGIAGGDDAQRGAGGGAAGGRRSTLSQPHWLVGRPGRGATGTVPGTAFGDGHYVWEDAERRTLLSHPRAVGRRRLRGRGRTGPGPRCRLRHHTARPGVAGAAAAPGADPRGGRRPRRFVRATTALQGRPPCRGEAPHRSGGGFARSRGDGRRADGGDYRHRGGQGPGRPPGAYHRHQRPEHSLRAGRAPQPDAGSHGGDGAGQLLRALRPVGRSQPRLAQPRHRLRGRGRDRRPGRVHDAPRGGGPQQRRHDRPRPPGRGGGRQF